MSFNKKIKNKIKKHALEDFPNECCGLIIGTEEGEDTYKCNNQAKDKKNFFRIGVEDYLSASTEGEVMGCYHSHTEEYHCLGFSEFDKKTGKAHELKLIMYSVGKDEFKEYIPHGEID